VYVCSDLLCSYCELPFGLKSTALATLQPSIVLAHLERTTASVDEHGDNASAEWSPDGNRIVIQVRSARYTAPGWAEELM
jgi:hypothetical protein